MARRDYAGQNARANARARALGYRSKDDAAKRRRAGNPTSADVVAGSAMWQRLPGGRLWVRIPLGNDRQRAKGEALVAKLVPTLPASAAVALTVRFDTGEWRDLTGGAGVPVRALTGGLELFIADRLVNVSNASNGGVASSKTDTPLTQGKTASLATQDMFEVVTVAQLVLIP